MTVLEKLQKLLRDHPVDMHLVALEPDGFFATIEADNGDTVAECSGETLEEAIVGALDGMGAL